MSYFRFIHSGLMGLSLCTLIRGTETWARRGKFLSFQPSTSRLRRPVSALCPRPSHCPQNPGRPGSRRGLHYRLRTQTSLFQVTDRMCRQPSTPQIQGFWRHSHPAIRQNSQHFTTRVGHEFLCSQPTCSHNVGIGRVTAAARTGRIRIKTSAFLCTACAIAKE
jgi:hypothetical protein